MIAGQTTVPDATYRRPVKKSVVRNNVPSKTTKIPSEVTKQSDTHSERSPTLDATSDETNSHIGIHSDNTLSKDSYIDNPQPSLVSSENVPNQNNAVQSTTFMYDIEYHEEHVDYLESQMDILEEKIDVLQREKQYFSEKSAKLNDKILKLESTIRSLEESNKSYKIDIAEKKKVLSRHNQEMAKQRKLVEKLESQLTALKAKREPQARSAAESERGVEGKDDNQSSLTVLMATIEQKNDIVDELFRSVNDLKEELNEM